MGRREYKCTCNPKKMTGNNLGIPPNATIRQEYVKCGNPDCQKSHGPYPLCLLERR